MGKKALFGIIGLLLVGVIPLSARRFETKNISIPPDDIKLLRANIELAAGRFTIAPGESKEIVTGDVEYDGARVEVFSEYKKRGATGYLEIGSDILSKTNIDTDDNRWDLILSRDYLTELTVDIGMCQAELDLGGIPLIRLKMDIGAADGRLIFSAPNPERLEDIDIDAGASSLDLDKLGNANFDNLNFEGGVGKFKLDFTGEYKSKSHAEISIGLGKAVIYIPSGLPVRIEAEDNFLSAVKFRNAGHYEIEDGYFESRDYRESKTGLALKVDVGLGKVEIIWVD
jgi:hypothetical protein